MTKALAALYEIASAVAVLSTLFGPQEHRQDFWLFAIVLALWAVCQRLQAITETRQ